MGKLIEEEIVASRSGFGAQKDVSDKLEDMKFAEKLICTKEVFEALARQPVLTDENGKDYKYITVSKDVLAGLGYGNGKDKESMMLGAAMQKINSIFVALKVPYKTQTYTSSNATSVEKVVKRGKDAGETKAVKIADKVKIFKYSDAFDITQYAAVGCGRFWKDSDKELDYEEPTDGVRSRVLKWITEIGVNEVGIETLKKVGITLEEVETPKPAPTPEATPAPTPTPAPKA